MSRLRGTVLLSLAMLVGGLATGRTMFYNVFFLLLGVIILSYLWAWAGVNWLRLTRHTRSRRAQVGQAIEEVFELRNTGSLPKLWLEVIDGSNLPGHRASHVATNIPSDTAYAWTTRTYCLERGRYRLGPITLISSDPFGLFTIQRNLRRTTNVVVYPATFELQSFPLPTGTISGGDALRRRTHLITPNASGVRDYQAGDSFNRIHWPSSARKNRLIVKEFELDPMSDVWLVLDMAASVHYGDRHFDAQQILNQAHSSEPPTLELPPSTEEYCISLAASVAQHFLRRDQAVGLVTVAQSWEFVQADRGERQIMKILETLSVLRAEGRIPLHEILHSETTRLPRGATVIIVTSSVDVRWVRTARYLARSGLRVAAVLVDPQTFGGTQGIDEVVAELETSAILPVVVRHGLDWLAAFNHTRTATWAADQNL